MTQDIYSVSRLNSELHQVLKGSFPLLWVEGEISNLSMPRSGHWYFSVKDAYAQMRCAVFRHKRHWLRLTPRDGMQVLVRARVALYEPRGDCQLVVEHIEEAGTGQLQHAFEALKQKLQAEGLFDQTKKKPLPEYPGRIGVITSLSAAALRDVLQILARRYPLAQIVIYPGGVQGDQAPAELRAALTTALQRAEVEVLILTRGGGSLEDLAAFNDEALARLIAGAEIPVVSAVGHEIDFTIADFVADRRAPTPSAAAELVSPEQKNLTQQFARLSHKLSASVQRRLKARKQLLQQLNRRLERAHPGILFRQHQQRLEKQQHYLMQYWLWRMDKARQRLHVARQRLQARRPSEWIKQTRELLSQLAQRLQTVMENRLRAQQAQLQANVGELQALSPLATLQRGYSIVQSADQRRVVRSVDDVAMDETLMIRLKQGQLDVKVVRKWGESTLTGC